MGQYCKQLICLVLIQLFMWVKWAAATAIIYNSRKRVDQNQNTASKSKRWPANLQFAGNPNQFIFKSLVAFRYFWMNWQLWPVWPLAKLSNIIQPISSTMKGPNLQSDTSAPMKTHTEQTPQLKAFRSWIWVGKKHMKSPVSYHSNKEVLPKKKQHLPGPSWWKVFMAKFGKSIVPCTSCPCQILED